jgi:hypothetical protein
MRLAIAASIVLALASVARSQAPGMTAPPDTHIEGSYRLQTAAVDASAILLSVVAAKLDSRAVLGAAATTYVAGPALVHLYHQHPGRAAASVALRVGLPLVLALLGAELSNRPCNDPECLGAPLAGAIYGFVGGAIAASAIDIGYLSRGEDRAAPAALPPPPPPSQPLASPEPHEVRVSFAFPF